MSDSSATLWTVACQAVHGDSPGKNTRVGGYALLQGVFPTQGSNPHRLCLLHWQMDSLPLSHLGSPRNLFSSSSGGQKSKIKVLAEMLLLEALKENLFHAPSWWPLATLNCINAISAYVFTWTSPWVSVGFLFYKDKSH